jgi:hypothetical protein
LLIVSLLFSGPLGIIAFCLVGVVYKYYIVLYLVTFFEN